MHFKGERPIGVIRFPEVENSILPHTVYRRSFGQAKHIQVLQRPDTNVIYSDLAVLFMSILSIIIPLF